MSYDQDALILPLNGVNGGTSFPDFSRHDRPVTAFGNAQISDAQSKFYGSSLLLDGSGDYLRCTAAGIGALTTSLFTIDIWFRPTSLAALQVVVGSRDDGTSPNTFWFLRLGTDGKLTFTVRATSGSTSTAIPCNVVTDLAATINTWNHVRVARNGTVSVGLNGTAAVLTGTNTTNTYGSSPNGIILGADIATSYFTGNLQDFRFVFGAALSATGATPAKLIAPVAGTITDDAGAPVERRIWVIPRAAQSRVFSGLSDAGDGSYSIDAPNLECARVVLDDAAGTQHNDLIDRVDAAA